MISERESRQPKDVTRKAESVASLKDLTGKAGSERFRSVSGTWRERLGLCERFRSIPVAGDAGQCTHSIPSRPA